jgi:YegS/Rv2252/BmrU family lipid kinase
MPRPAQRRDVVVVLNGISRRKKLFYQRLLPVISEICNVQVYETMRRNEAIEIASKAVDQNVNLILAAGGDGTLNQVVHGVFSGRENSNMLPAIGLLPLGSGNDFARTMGITTEPSQLRKLLTAFTTAEIDLGKVRFTTFEKGTAVNGQSERYFINVADIGMGPEVVDRVSKSSRLLGGKIGYFKSIITTFFSYRLIAVKAIADEWVWQGKLRSLGVANGKFYGHGLCIAPDAKADDGNFSVFICGNVSVLDFVLNTGKLKKGKHIRLAEVHYKAATRVALTSEARCMIEADGEVLGLLPATVFMAERRLKFLC